MASNIKRLFQKMAVVFFFWFCYLFFCHFIENVFGLCVYNICLEFLRGEKSGLELSIWMGTVNKERTLETKCHVN